MNNSQTSFLTIITRNYYWWAKTWADAIAEHHPESTIHIAIADTPQAEHLEALKEYEVLCVPEIAQQLGIENYPRMAYQYTPFELTCSLKPFLMNFLGERFEKVIYLDADTLILRPFTQAYDALENSEIVAAPHLTQPVDVEQETRIRNAGTLNGGFVAIRTGPSSSRFLEWWSERCRYDCCIDPYAGKFVDQSWLDLATGYFDAFQVIRDETINVAYWNLASRHIAFNDGRFEVNGKPLTMFHFSGMDPEQEDKISCFETSKVQGDLKRLVRQYKDRLVANRREELNSIECGFSCYHDGIPVDPIHREAIRQRVKQLADINDPFDTTANPNIRSKVESIREQLILSRKHWQLEELQRLANDQTEWIQKQSQRRLDRRLVQACRRLYSLVKDRWFDPGSNPELAASSSDQRKAA